MQPSHVAATGFGRCRSISKKQRAPRTQAQPRADSEDPAETRHGHDGTWIGRGGIGTSQRVSLSQQPGGAVRLIRIRYGQSEPAPPVPAVKFCVWKCLPPPLEGPAPLARTEDQTGLHDTPAFRKSAFSPSILLASQPRDRETGPPTERSAAANSLSDGAPCCLGNPGTHSLARDYAVVFLSPPIRAHPGAPVRPWRVPSLRLACGARV